MDRLMARGLGFKRVNRGKSDPGGGKLNRRNFAHCGKNQILGLIVEINEWVRSYLNGKGRAFVVLRDTPLRVVAGVW
jgi:hypothetical protein